ncbi:MAG TPA: YggS family pyridoxal phosphate-dependent enzyme [Anaerolineales bacterium]|nr:YggS family pyridoxal phosphate-dependent enzyme [Anaerolineales bacterium]
MSNLSSPAIAENYRRVLENIARTAQKAGRNPDDVQLVVVTKGHPVETAQAVVAAGARCLGENYVEEALPKIEVLSAAGLEWHMIGHVQSRKARHVVDSFAWVHSVDRLKLARRLDRFAGERGQVLPILLECNVSGEETKFGWPVWDEPRWPEFAEDLVPLMELPHLEVRGLMTMPPYDPDPEKSRPYFERLVRLRDFLAIRFPDADWSELSMGMSNDYEVAVQSGATIVRVGTAIVGPRT